MSKYVVGCYRGIFFAVLLSAAIALPQPYVNRQATSDRPEAVDLGYSVPSLPAEVRRPDDCAQFAMYAILDNMGCEVDVSSFERMMTAKHESGGTNVSDLPRQMWPWAPARYHATGNLSDLREQLQKGRPALVVTMWPLEKREAFGHGMVVTGYNGDAWMVMDARGVFDVSECFFTDVWTGQWLEVGAR